MKTSVFHRLSFSLILAAATIIATTAAWAEPWKFGVMSDTQWTVPDDGMNPNTVAVGIIDQLNQEFINNDVKFVVQVGDLVDSFSPAAMDTRAQSAQALYAAGIGFFPLRGNHEGSQAAALKFQTNFLQTQGTGTHLFGAANFTSPFANLKGLSYSFDYAETRFVLLDQFTRTDGTGSTNMNIIDQQNWISSTLAGKPANGHAFVFSHKNLIGENHTDVLFGANPASNPSAQNAFIGSLAENGVRYCQSGHDHVHQRSIITSPDGASKVQQIIGASDSSKFYIPLGNPELPGTVNNDVKFNSPTRETSLVQERNNIGYYIYTVDGPCVSVDYYSAKAYPSLVADEYLIFATPTLDFIKQETFGYCLNGKEFLVGQGQPYTTVQDSYRGTAVRILSGTNGSMERDGSLRPVTHSVETGWSPRSHELASDVLHLWGMANALGSAQTDVYVLSLSYDPKHADRDKVHGGALALATRDGNGVWINAVDRNFSGKKNFVLGAWDPSYNLGTYGIDPGTNTVWAVINYNGDFSVAHLPGLDRHDDIEKDWRSQKDDRE